MSHDFIAPVDTFTPPYILFEAKVALWADALVLVRFDCNLASTRRYKLVASRSNIWHGACYTGSW